MNRSELKSFVESHTFVKLLAALGVIIIVLFIFEAGVITGYHKAAFAEHWAEHYSDNFGPMNGFPPRGIANPHGTAGSIVSVSLPTFVVAGPSEAERTVEVDAQTIIRKGTTLASTTDLVKGATVIVIGTPDDNGIIDAGFVRIMTASTTPSSATP
jgi:hypothetical protein